MLKTLTLKRFKSTFNVPEGIQENIWKYVLENSGGATLSELRSDISSLRMVYNSSSGNKNENYGNRISTVLENRKKKILQYGVRETVAYLLDRFERSFIANLFVFNEIKRRNSIGESKSMLSFGSGPGTSILAASQVFAIDRVEAVELSSDMVNAASFLLKNCSTLNLDRIRFARFMSRGDHTKYHIVVASNVLNELPSDELREEAIKELMKRCKEYLIVIENSSTSSFRIVEAARRIALESEAAQVVAPCYHDSRCPLIDSEDLDKEPKYPCETTQRYWKGVYTRKVEKSKLNFSDSRFSYVVIRMGTGLDRQNKCRIIKEPLKVKKNVYLDLCTSKGVLDRVVLNKNTSEDYKRARDSNLGEEWIQEDSKDK